MKKIPLNIGKNSKNIGYFALVDDYDYGDLSKHKWSWYKHGNTGYAMRTIRLSKNKTIGVSMHRQIMGLKHKGGKQIDHINRNGIDNRRSNLRICTQSQNSMNRTIAKNNTSGYKGVSFNKKSKKWICAIKIKGIQVVNKQCKTKRDAINFYFNESKKRFGSFARIK